ncbi:hypothetical protein CK203_098854 [Vitis vinifera]|uniref:Uncharacterized protein n=1 Tax=Vitis vinifera TaxID=29760 RepID=A0A438D4X1_VITVI|nr:hypothetical protein CK203_098854 [Vitis vinifera]
MAAQKEEMEASFAAQKKELEEEYQQQADEMYFFGYRCCMKKNEIMHDTPSFPSDEETRRPGFRIEILESDAVKLWDVVSYNGLRDSKAADDVLPYELAVAGRGPTMSMPTTQRARGQKLVLKSSIAHAGLVKDRLYKCPPIRVKRAACTRVLCACLGSSGRVPVWRYSMMAFVQSWPSAWFALMVLQMEASAMEGLVCTCIGNYMASLMGREAPMPARASTHPFSISRHALILSFVFFLDVSYHELGITVDPEPGDRQSQGEQDSYSGS